MKLLCTKSIFNGAIAACAIVAFSCGGSLQKEPVVIATSESPKEETVAETPPQKTEAEDTSSSDIHTLLAKDERRAAGILNSVMCDLEGNTSSWATIYALRLGIKHDAACAADALGRGIHSENPLLRALSWRWIASSESFDVPAWSDTPENDPVVRTMAAVAFLARGSIPPALRDALLTPTHTPSGSDRSQDLLRRLSQYRILSLPFDDGPLALGLTFVESRLEEWLIKKDSGENTWAAVSLREELLNNFGIDQSTLSTQDATAAQTEKNYSSIGQQLENRLVSQPNETLRKIAISGEATLRTESLRAIAITAKDPVAGDFASCAAALQSQETHLQIEGARTFLLLTLRIQNN